MDRKRVSKLMCYTIIFIVIFGVLRNTKEVRADTTSNKGQAVVAKEEENPLSKIMSGIDVDTQMQGLYDYINNIKTDAELLNGLDIKNYFESYMKNGNGEISLDKIINCIISYTFKEVKAVIALAVSMIVIALICSLLKNLQLSFTSEGISNIAFYACYVLLIVLLSKSFILSITLAKDVITEISDFMAALLPILVMLLGSAGGITQAATMDPIILGATIVIPRLYLNIIIPLILMTFVLQFANNISTEHRLDNFCKLLKQTTIWLQGITLTIFIGLLTIRGITSSTLDVVTLKTAKFAVDNFIPIVGKSFSDAISTVAGYSLVMKNAVSTIGLVVIILLMLYPIIKLFLISVVYKLSAAVMEPIADKRLTSSVQAAGESIVLIMSCVLSVSLMFFILISIMASAGKFVVGG